MRVASGHFRSPTPQYERSSYALKSFPIMTKVGLEGWVILNLAVTPCGAQPREMELSNTST